MKRLLVVLALVLSAGLTAGAQDDRPTCAVMTFEARAGLTRDEAALLSDRFESELQRLGTFRLMSRSNMGKILEAQKFSIECSDATCAIEVGKILAIEHVVFGSIGKLGNAYTVNASLANVETAQIENSASHDITGTVEELLLYGMAAAARKLTGARGGAPRPAGAAPAVAGPSGAELSDLLVQVREAEEEAARKKQEEEAARRLLARELARRKGQFEQDYASYRKVVESEHAADGVKREAWRRLCEAWGVKDGGPEPKGLVWDETSGLLRVADGIAGREMAVDLGGGVKMDLVWIPPGEFDMGSPESEPQRESDEGPVHHVIITKGFWMGKHEVTQGQWMQVMGKNPSHFNSVGVNAPVEQVTWNDCQEFLRKLNARVPDAGVTFRLPTEAEWEYACRAGTTTPFAFGDCLSTDDANYDGNYPLTGCRKGQYRETTVEAGSFRPNDWGLYDMHGNVWEWCADWYGDYPRGSVSDPTGPGSGSARVLRGGSWYNNARLCRSADRVRYVPGLRYDGLGFRVVGVSR